MDSAYWKEQKKYLQLTRKYMWNEDYVEFISLGQDGEEYAEHLAAFGETTSENDGKHSVVSAKCHLISFGRKK